MPLAVRMPQFVVGLDEIERQFLTEFDYRGEARNLQRIRRSILPSWRRHVYIPYVVEELCTKEVMVMEFLEVSRNAEHSGLGLSDDLTIFLSPTHVREPTWLSLWSHSTRGLRRGRV